MSADYLARITSGPQGRGYDVVEMIRADAVACTLHVRHTDGMVTWSDDWALVPDLEAAGQLAHVNRGPDTYGHVDVYFV